MSMSPNNPFEDPQNDQGYLQDQGSAQTPKSKNAKGCLIGCGIAGILGLVLCCGGGVFLAQFGVSALADQIEGQIASDPAIVEHIGDIESFEVNWSATIEEAQKTGDQDSGLIFEIKGSEGSGQFLVKQDKGGEGIDAATLILSDGTRIPINLGSGARELEEMDIELNDFIDTGDVDSGETDAGDGDTETIEIAVPDVPAETKN